jgi:aspartyl-tRNA(Asn)/glutamyl-tRNA(Gln) amidotransferase subunit C
MSLSREDVAALGQLARIALSEEELVRAEKELDGILGFVDRLQKVDTKDVEEASPPPVEAMSFRADEVLSCDALGRELILKNFPARQEDLLKVPGVFEKPKG